MLVLYQAVYGTEELQKFAQVFRIVTQFEALPEMQNYLRSDKFKKLDTFFPSSAKFSGKEFIAEYTQKFV